MLEDLVSSLAFLGSEEERLASLPYMVIRKEAACPSLSIESTFSSDDYVTRSLFL